MFKKPSIAPRIGTLRSMFSRSSTSYRVLPIGQDDQESSHIRGHLHVLLIFNATYLWLTTNLARRTRTRSHALSGEDVQKLFPLKVRKIWILNNASCGAPILATYLTILCLDIQGREFSFIMVDRMYFTVFIVTLFLIIVANCCIDLSWLVGSYWRSESCVADVHGVCSRRCSELEDKSANRPAAS